MRHSPNKQRAYEFIKRYAQSNGETPTIAEIGEQVQLRSSASVYDILVKLEKEGLITRVANISRGIRLT